MNLSFYICNVKSVQRHENAGLIQHFLWSIFRVIIGLTPKVCGSSNAHKVSTEQNLTAPLAYIFNV